MKKSLNATKTLSVKISFAFVCFIVFFLVLINQSFAKELLNASQFILSNGLKLVVIPHHRAPVVEHMVLYEVGGYDDFLGKSGLAHFSEHMMFRGSPNITDGEFSKIIAREGGTQNAFTAYHYTAYHQNIAVDRLEMVMAMEADRMRQINLTSEAFETEHKVVIEERLSRYDNVPSRLLGEHIDATLWLNHPRSRPLIGSMNEIKGLTIDDIKKFHFSWYAPNNATVIVSGDITPEKAKELATKHYGSLPAKRLPERNPIEKMANKISARIEMQHHLVSQPFWQKSYVVPSQTTAKERRVTASLEVLAEMLGNPSIGRLYNNLVVKDALAIAVGCWYSPLAKGDISFRFYAYPRKNEEQNPLIEEAINKEIDNIVKGNFTEQELEITINRLKANLVYLRDTPSSMVETVASVLGVGLNLDYIETWADAISSVTVNDVVEAAKLLNNNTPNAVGVMLPYSINKSEKP